VKPVYIWRLAITLPAGSEQSGWEPAGWRQWLHDQYGPQQAAEREFTWPPRIHWLSAAGARKRRELLESWGATVEVTRSLPVGWPPALALRGTVLQDVLAALGDAADYRRDQGDCTACTPAAKCGDHAVDDSVASMYDLLAEQLQELQGAGARS
jgi:hypothetical protein